MKYLLPRATTFALLVLLATACSKNEDVTPAADTSNDNMLLGNPSGAVSDPASQTNYLLVSKATIRRGLQPGPRQADLGELAFDLD